MIEARRWIDGGKPGVAALMGMALAAVLTLDGTLTALRGKRFLDWQARVGPDWYRRRVLPFFYKWPEPLLRLGGLAQAAASVALLAGKSKGSL
jgi:hypothetical protein